MKKRPKNRKKIVRGVVIVGGILALIQLGIILYFQSSSHPVEVRQLIQQEVDKTSLAPERKIKLKVQLALNHYREVNEALPAGLEQLVPLYFDSIPVDPLTNKPFRYVPQDMNYTLGEVTAHKARKDADGQPLVEAKDKKLLDQEALIASLDAPPESASFVYDPSGKRDPFRPFDAAPKVSKGEGLAAYDLGQLRLAAILNDIVSIEDVSGKGFIARKGTKIGLNNGEIVEILPDRIKVLEVTKDFTGKEQNTVREMMLRTPGQRDDRR